MVEETSTASTVEQTSNGGSGVFRSGQEDRELDRDEAADPDSAQRTDPEHPTSSDPRRTLQASGEGKEIRELPLTHYYSFMGYAHKQRLVRLVNELIAMNWEPPEAQDGDAETAATDPTNSRMTILDEELDDRWCAYGCAVLFIGAFVALVFVSRREVCVISKNHNIVAIVRRTSLWSNQEETYRWQDVELVEIHRATQNRKTELNVFLNIEPYSSWVPLSEHGAYASEEEAEEICSEIRDFIGIQSWQSLLQLKKLS